MPITPDSILLTGRRAVVTGAAQGIGAAIATTLARFGADVAICDRDADGLARTAGDIAAEGRHAHAELLDVRDADAVNRWIASLERVDVLVNNAGGGFNAAFLDTWLQGLPVAECLHRGVSAGARSVGAIGGTAGQPTLDQLATDRRTR